MKKALLLMLMLACTYATFTITALDVIIDTNADGSAEVTEIMYLLITTNYHISIYKNGLSQNDLASWNALTGLSDMRYHVDNRYVDVRNVVVRPQPVSKCNPLADLCHGELRISYHVDAYRDKEGNAANSTGMFTVEEYKPRTARYELNSAVLEFEESELGDVILGKNQRLTIVLPEGATQVEVSPLPEDLEETGAGGEKEFSWENTVLAHFRLSFEMEDNLDTEVLEFFMDARTTITDLVSGPQGPAVIILALVVIGAYIHLQAKVRVGGGQK